MGTSASPGRIAAKQIWAVKNLLPLLEDLAKTGKSLLVITEEVDGEALATLDAKKLRGTLKACAVKPRITVTVGRPCWRTPPTLTGGKAFTENLGIKLETRS